MHYSSTPAGVMLAKGADPQAGENPGVTEAHPVPMGTENTY